VRNITIVWLQNVLIRDMSANMKIGRLLTNLFRK